MRLSHAIDVGVLVATLGLGTYLLATGGAPTQAEMDARANNVFPAFIPEDIDAIRINKRGGQAPLVLRRDRDAADQPAYFLGPKGTRRADEAAVAELISALDFATWNRRLSVQSAPDLEKFGLRDPELEVAVSAGPRSYRIVIGKVAPSPKGARYLLLDGNNVDTVLGVVRGEFLESLSRDEQEFRGTLLFPYSRRETTRLSIKRGEQSLSLRADPLGFLLEPLQASSDGLLRADRTLTDLVFFQLARGKFETYLLPSEVNDDQVGSFIEVTQQSSEGPTYQVRLGGDCSEDGLLTYAVRTKPDEATGCASKSILSAFEVDRERFVDRTAVPLNPDEIDHVTIELGGKKLDLIRRDAGYLLLSRNSESVEKESGDELLQTLARSRLTLIPAPDTTKMQKGSISVQGQSPLTAVSLGRASRGATRGTSDPGTDGVRQIDLDVYAPLQGTDLFLHRQDDGAWLSVQPEERWAFLPDDTWAKNRTLTSFSPSEIQKVEILFEEEKRTEIQRSKEGFRFADSNETTDVALTRDLLLELAELKAVRFVSPALPRPEEAPLKVTFWRSEDGRPGEEEETIFVGDRVQGGHLAWSSLTDGTFVIPVHARLVFATPLIDRGKARIEPDDLDTLEIRTDGRVYSFERQAGLLRAKGGLATDALVHPLTDALRSITVVAAFERLPSELVASRSRSELTLEFTSVGQEKGDQRSLHVGPITVFFGQSVRLAWFSGESTTFLLSAASLSDLDELL